jgi:hypothetical protein
VKDPKVDAHLGPAKNFRIPLAERLRVLLGGVPAHIRRKRQIEDLLEQHLGKLREHKARGATTDELTELARSLDLGRINELIDKHNRYYVIEANLPLDPATGAVLDRGGSPFAPLDSVTPESLLALLG